MIEQNRFIMIGATSRNVGKTEFACQLISRVSRREPVVGVKITTVAERNGQCPRGGDGCGVCSALTEPYCVTQETVTQTGKDTARLLQAGAVSVFWLRVLKDHLADGVTALLDRLPPDLPVVCESNSARSVLAPGVFVVVKSDQDTSVKQSCQAVMAWVDYWVTYDGTGWDVSSDRCVWAGRKWSLVR
ncbi:MAG: hypothetical protein K9N55_11675 [Phycisphaerae bacterium]|nr:hypothetical protein [Phycisphaerae bacterium]